MDIETYIYYTEHNNDDGLQFLRLDHKKPGMFFGLIIGFFLMKKVVVRN